MEVTVYWVWVTKQGEVEEDSEEVYCEECGEWLEYWGEKCYREDYDFDPVEAKASKIMDEYDGAEKMWVCIWDSEGFDRYENDADYDAEQRTFKERLLEFLDDDYKEECDGIIEYLKEEKYLTEDDEEKQETL